jgi:hypothetical protein
VAAFAARFPVATVALRTGSTGCYLSFIEGELAPSDQEGTLVIEKGGPMPGHHTVVVWPGGYTARRSLLGQIEVVSYTGRIVARTGEQVHISGGYNDQAEWLACGLEPIP